MDEKKSELPSTDTLFTSFSENGLQRANI